MSDSQVALQKLEERFVILFREKKRYRDREIGMPQIPYQLFELEDIVHELVGIIASQQEELLLMREQLRHLGIR